MERREQVRRAGDVTESDVSRIHKRLDDIVEAVQQVALDHSKTRGEVSQLVALVAKSEANRAATCPHSEALTTVKSEMRVLKAIGGIVIAALLIPGVQWFGSRLWALLIGG
jgi:hypothetical protein